MQRNDMSNPIHDVDLVISVGGDGTLLRASHFLNSSIPVLGVNSDPTCPDEVSSSDYCQEPYDPCLSSCFWHASKQTDAYLYAWLGLYIDYSFAG